MLKTKELLDGIKGCNSRSCVVGQRQRNGNGVDGPCTCPPQVLRMAVGKFRHALEDTKPYVGSTRKVLDMQRRNFLCSLCPTSPEEPCPGFTQEEAMFWREETRRFEGAERRAIDKVTELKEAMREIHDTLGNYKNGHECKEGVIRPYGRFLCSSCIESPWKTIKRLEEYIEQNIGGTEEEGK